MNPAAALSQNFARLGKSVLNRVEHWVVLANSPQQARGFARRHMEELLRESVGAKGVRDRLEQAAPMSDELRQALCEDIESSAAPPSDQLRLYEVECVGWADMKLSEFGSPVFVTHVASVLRCEALPDFSCEPHFCRKEDLDRWRAMREAFLLRQESRAGVRRGPRPL